MYDVWSSSIQSSPTSKKHSNHIIFKSFSKVALIPGDGIGPEISEAVKTVFKAAQVPISWVEVDVKPVLLPTGQTTIPQKAIDQIKQIKIGLKG